MNRMSHTHIHKKLYLKKKIIHRKQNDIIENRIIIVTSKTYQSFEVKKIHEMEKHINTISNIYTQDHPVSLNEKNKL